MAGNAAALVAIPWFVLQTTGSASKTGITAAAGIVPVIVSGLFGGPYVDRLGYRRASIVSDLASFAAVAAIPLLYSTVGLAFWQLVLLVFLGALLDAPGVTARASMLPEVAEPAGWSLERVSGAAAAVNRAARLAGAPIAGLLIAFVGPTNVLWIDAVTFLFSAAAIAAGVPARATAPVHEEGERTNYVSEIKEGFAFLYERRALFVLTVVVTVTNMLDAVAIVALPVYAIRVYGTAWSLGLDDRHHGGGLGPGRARVFGRTASGCRGARCSRGASPARRSGIRSPLCSRRSPSCWPRGGLGPRLGPDQPGDRHGLPRTRSRRDAGSGVRRGERRGLDRDAARRPRRGPGDRSVWAARDAPGNRRYLRRGRGAHDLGAVARRSRSPCGCGRHVKRPGQPRRTLTSQPSGPSSSSSGTAPTTRTSSSLDVELARGERARLGSGGRLIRPEDPVFVSHDYHATPRR